MCWFELNCRDFLYLDVHSQLAFNAMDRNKDGFITKGELKLAKKKMSMKDVEEARRIFFLCFHTKGRVQYFENYLLERDKTIAPIRKFSSNKYYCICTRKS